MTIVFVLTIAVLYGAGAYLIMQQNLVRVVIGIAMISHGANLLLLLAGGPPGAPPMIGSDAATFSDPLPQAMALTAIVITFGITAFLLAVVYRSWALNGNDVVEENSVQPPVSDQTLPESES